MSSKSQKEENQDDQVYTDGAFGDSKQITPSRNVSIKELAQQKQNYVMILDDEQQISFIKEQKTQQTQHSLEFFGPETLLDVEQSRNTKEYETVEKAQKREVVSLLPNAEIISRFNTTGPRKVQPNPLDEAPNAPEENTGSGMELQRRERSRVSPLRETINPEMLNNAGGGEDAMVHGFDESQREIRFKYRLQFKKMPSVEAKISQNGENAILKDYKTRSQSMVDARKEQVTQNDRNEFEKPKTSGETSFAGSIKMQDDPETVNRRVSQFLRQPQPLNKFDGLFGKLKNAMKDDTKMAEETINRRAAFDRPRLSLEKAAKFLEEKKNVTAKHNKELYLRNYGLNITIPSLYVQTSKFWKRDPSFVLKTEYYVQPDDKLSKVYTYELNGNRQETTFYDRMVNQKKGVVLKLIQNKDKNLKTLDRVLIEGGEKIVIKFSKNGDYFAYYCRYLQILRVFKIDSDISDLIPKIRNQDSIFSYDGAAVKELDHHHQFQFDTVHFLTFDDNNRFISINNKTQIMIFNIQTGKHWVHNLNESLYENFVTVKMSSKGDEDYQCYVIAQLTQKRSVHFFDINSSSPWLRTLNYIDERHHSFKCKISDNYQVITLVNVTENYQLSFNKLVSGGSFSTQINLTSLKNRIVEYIQCDETGFGFLFAHHKEYDQFISITHSNREGLMLSVERDVEPGIIQVHDLNFKIIDLANYKFECRLLNIQDEIFKIDTFNFRVESKNYEVSHSIEKVVQPKLNKKDTLNYEGQPENYLPIKRMFTNSDQLFTRDGGEQNKSGLVHRHYFAKDIKIESYEHLQIRGHFFNWPYFVYVNMDGNLVIINAFEQNVVNQIKLSSKVENQVKILEMYITNTSDLFIAGRMGDCIQIFMLDLDKGNVKNFDDGERLEKHHYLPIMILQYPVSDVQNKSLVKIHVRGTSRNQLLPDGSKQETNEKIMIFALHENSLYSWTMMDETSVDNQNMQFVCNVKSKDFHNQNDSKFYMLQEFIDEDGIARKQIIKFKIYFSEFRSEIVYQEDPSQLLIDFKLDDSQGKLIVLSKPLKQEQNQMTSKRIFKIFDLKQRIILFEKTIKNKTLIGRLESGLFTFVDGHIYYSNNVIKIRYDLINSKMVSKYDDDQIFDFYYEIFKMEKNEIVKATTPLQSNMFHRFLYIIQDRVNQTPKRIMILPYLHDRKIYIKQHKKNVNYIYSSIETSIAEEQEYQDAHPELQFKNRNQLQSKQTPSFLNYHQSNLRRALTMSKIIADEVESENSFTCIMCNNLTDNKIYIYSQSGVLLKQMNSSNIIQKYGKVLTFSHNCRNIIHQKTSDQIAEMVDLTNEDKELEQLTINLMHLSIFKYKFIKKINFYSRIKELLPAKTWLTELKTPQSMIKFAEFEFVINNNFDVCCKISRKSHFNDTKHTQVNSSFVDHVNHASNKDKENETFETFYVFEAGQNESSKENKSEFQKSVYMLQHGLVMRNQTNWLIEKGGHDKKMHMNKKYIFFQDEKLIEFLPLSLPWTLEAINHIKINMVHLKDKLNINKYKIKEIQTGENPDLLLIVITGSNQKFQVITWNMVDNSSISFTDDIAEGYQILWDDKGTPNILTEGRVIFTNQGCKTKVFTNLPNENSTGSQNENDRAFNSYIAKNIYLPTPEADDGEHQWIQGHRFDSKNNNWLLIQEYLSLSFSFMSFVIKDKIENDDVLQQNNIFDPEPYNYIFNKSTSFLDGQFVQNDFKQLERVLQNFSEQDIALVNLIAYTQDIIHVESLDKNHECYRMNSAMNIAYQAGNNRSVEIILHYLSMCNSPLNNYIQLLPKLMRYQNFHNFLKCQELQTIQMEKKQVLRVRKPMNDNIVKISFLNSCYIDDEFFKNQMDEIQGESKYFDTSTNFPVKILAVKIDWLFLQGYENEALVFLQSLTDNSDSLDVFKIQPVIMIVEFLFNSFKTRLYRQQLPIFFMQVICFFLQIHILETIDVQFHKVDPPDGLVHWQQSEHDVLFSKLLSYNNALGFALQIYQLLGTFMHLNKCSDFSFKRVSFDLLFIFTNVILNALIYVQTAAAVNDTKKLTLEYTRILSAFVMVLMLYRLWNFAKMMDEISPLIDQIMSIFKNIGWFLCMFVLALFFFTEVFFILGKNQMDFGDLTADEEATLPYRTLVASLLYVSSMALAETDTDPFLYGNKSQMVYLIIFFYIAVINLLIHLLNMLIAMMGNIYNARVQVAEQVRIRDHLRFVVDNWYLSNVAFKDEKPKIKYIVAAFLEKSETKEEDQVTQLQQQVCNLNHKFEKEIDEILWKQKETFDLAVNLGQQFDNLQFGIQASKAQ